MHRRHLSNRVTKPRKLEIHYPQGIAAGVVVDVAVVLEVVARLVLDVGGVLVAPALF